MKDEDKKERYWQYFTTPGVICYGYGVTAKRLAKIKPFIMEDIDFWGDMYRHGFPDNPADLCQHGRSNWAGMIYQTMIALRVIKP